MSISKAVRDAIRARLADPAEGFTATHTALAASYGVAPISIDFSGNAAVKQFFEGNVDVDDVLGSTPARRPLAQLYTRGSINTNACLRGLFSGQVEAILAIHIEQRGGNAVRDYESAADAVEETLYRVFMARLWSKPNEITFGGEMSVTRGPVIPADSNWRQTVTARLVFGAHVAE